MDHAENNKDAIAAAYDEESEAAGWYAPEVAYGLTFAHVKPGQSILDIGIGTGLASVLFHKAGLKVHGMDNSLEMLEACRSKGFNALQLHDLNKPPYPYDSESIDHVVCTGVMNFFSDLSTVFEETARILRKGGRFIFVVGDRAEHHSHEIQVRAEHAKSEKTATMYLHTPKQIYNWIERYRFGLVRSLAFTVFMDRERTKRLQVKAYLAIKP
ncbi:MAG: class I SAM-dependent methyltransferase [Desulfobacteraceae bacterium]|jgi:predicted TPR repeat methyltransferase